MARLVYSAICSLDGYVADEDGRFDWAVPGEEAHAFVNGLERSVGTYLFGRRMYETMRVWETMGTDPGDARTTRDFAAGWRTTDKVVYSRTLDRPATARTRIEREFAPEAVRRMVAAADRDVSVGGPTLAAHAFRAGLVQDCHVFLAPAVVGGGLRAFPDGVRLGLECVAERRFADGMVYVGYRVRG
ncbi:dihydrofolate reductase family protein [Marinactinospora rubrisoli]|uniref:Dihydrofolate reductase family protein n=1 Tax=Marinactinospora rubrisoli TaxID=2715399 RepID=A0ABW2KM40_9ACTN